MRSLPSAAVGGRRAGPGSGSLRLRRPDGDPSLPVRQPNQLPSVRVLRLSSQESRFVLGAGNRPAKQRGTKGKSRPKPNASSEAGNRPAKQRGTKGKSRPKPNASSEAGNRPAKQRGTKGKSRPKPNASSNPSGSSCEEGPFDRCFRPGFQLDHPAGSTNPEGDGAHRNGRRKRCDGRRCQGNGAETQVCGGENRIHAARISGAIETSEGGAVRTLGETQCSERPVNGERTNEGEWGEEGPPSGPKRQSLVDPASGDMLLSRIKPCKCEN